MPKSDFILGAFDSSQYSWCYKTNPVNFPTPERNVEYVEVPGRNGSLLIDHGGWQNVEATINVVIDGDFTTHYDLFRTLIDCESQQGYLTFKDSLYPGEERKVSIVKIDVATPTKTRGTVDVTISAKPQRYDTVYSTETVAAAAGDATYFAVSGIPNNIFNATFLQDVSDFGKYKDCIVIDTRTFGFDYKVRATYAESRPPSELYWLATGIDPMTNTAYSGWTAFYETVNQPMIEPVVEYASPWPGGNWHNSYDGFAYLVIETPLYYEVLDENGDVIGSMFTAKKTITGNYDYNIEPLIEIGLTGNALTGWPAVRLNGDSVIRLSVPSTITIGTDSYPLTVMWFDCETFNAYTVIAGTSTVYPLNKYVTVDGDMVIGGKSVTIEVNNGIQYAEITPRWWKL